MPVNHVVTQGQSLWSIAKERLGAGASDADVVKAKNELARVNGLSPEATLDVGQRLQVPDAFAGVVARSAAGEGTARLSAPRATGSAQAAHRARPFVDLKPVWSDAKLEPAGKVTVPDVAGVKVDATRVHFVGTRSMLHDDADYSVVGKLGKLSSAQFDDVKKAFGGRTSVTFDAGREYMVADFLPPAVQALLHKDLEVAEPVKLKGTKSLGEDIGYGREDYSVDLTMNCHGAAWEAMRAFQGTNDGKVSVFYGEMVTMDALTTTPPFRAIGEVKADKLADVLKLDLRPGDVVQFHNDGEFASASTNLMHSAVYVGGGLFFEKPNTEGAEKEDRANYVMQEETPFRLATLDMMAKPLDDATEGKFKVVVSRPDAPLPAAKEAFGAGDIQQDLEKWATKKGRALGIDLVLQLEQGMGGNIRNVYVSGLVDVPLAKAPDGTTKLG